jgi:ankyrin repeat protein
VITSSAIQPGLDQVLTGQVKDERHARIFANSEILDEQEFTIFHQIVLGFCHTELENQFKFNYRDIDLPDANGRTPLLWAAWRGETQKVKVLLELGADPNKKDLEEFSPLAKAAQSGHLDCVRALVKGGATVTTTTYWGLAPIHLACQNVLKGLRVVEYLLAHGATATATTPGGGTPLHFACNRGATSIVSLLLKHGVDIDVRNVSGDSPVMVAAQGGRDDITCLLIDTGARLDFQSNDGLNIVHFVVFGGSVRTFEALTKAVNDGRLPAVSMKAQHEGHGIKHCFGNCRRLRASGDSGNTPEETNMFQHLLDAVDDIK